MGLLLTVFVSLTCAAVAFYAFKYQQRRNLSHSNGCQPPNKYHHKEPIFGLDLFFLTGKLFQEHRYLPDLVRRFNEYGTTFESKSFGSSTINTIRPENLQAVFSTKFKDWGVQPVRLPAQDLFCGKGFITTDGAVWEHSRALLKPSFNRSNMTDLTELEKHLELLVDRIPTDGSVVDLQPLLFNLVCLYTGFLPALLPPVVIWL